MSKDKNSRPGLLARAGAELIKVQTNARDMGVVEFVETIVDAFNVPMFLSQRVLLKSIYGEDLDDTTPMALCGAPNGVCKGKAAGKCSVDHRVLLTERQLMDHWVKAEKTNWRHPRALLSQRNMSRSLEGKDLLSDFRYQAITVQAGMRCLSGDTHVFVAGQGYKRMDQLIEPATDTEQIAYTEGLQVLTQHGVKDVVNALARPATPTLRLTTASGIVMEGTPEHPLMTDQGWKQMEALCAGDAICVSTAPVPEAAYPEAIESEEELGIATLLGHWSLVKPCVPGGVMSGSLPMIKAYLKGLGALDCESRRFSAEFNSRTTARQTQLLLRGIGVWSKVYSSGDRWILELTPQPEAVDGLVYDVIVSIEHGLEPVYDICVPDGAEYLAEGVVSSNSSKSASMALLAAFEFFKAITHPCIQEEIGLPKSSPLYITAVASTERQALGTIFYYIKQYITGSTFFKTFIDAGEIIVRELDISFPAKNIIIASGHSQATGIVGRTALMVLFDELAMFSADETNASNAADVYQRVGRSTASVKAYGKIIALSSVKCEGDYMETLVKNDWDKQEDGCLVFDLTTFDVNPTLSLEETSIKQAYNKDLVSAQRDFENIRPGAIGQFLIPEVVKAACEGREATELIKYSALPIFRRRGEALDLSGGFEGPADEDAEDDVREMSGLQVGGIVPVPSKLVESYGHCDIALKKDSFGFACGHPEYIEGLGIATIIDICLEWVPRALGKNKFALIDLINVEDVLVEVAKARNLKELSFDQWNSASSIQRLYRENVITSQIHFSAEIQKKMFDSLRNRMNQGLVKFPNHPTLIEELLSLELREDKVKHPKNKDSEIPGRGKVSKDLVDCVIAINWKIAQLEREFVRTQSYGGAVPGRGHANIKVIGQTRASRSSKWNSR